MLKQPFLKIEDLSVNYGYIRALCKINLEVNQGEIVTLIGGNGAGKTTTLMAVSNLVEKAEGRIFFKGTDITRTVPDRIVKLGISHVPEGRKIFPSLSVYENLISGTMGNPRLTKKDILENLEKSYEMFPRLKERRRQNGGAFPGENSRCSLLPGDS